MSEVSQLEDCIAGGAVLGFRAAWEVPIEGK